MSLQVDPLAKFYEDENNQTPEEENDPLASYYEPNKTGYRDVVSEELRRHGVEPDIGEELERASEFGRAEVTRGAISGATLGFSEHVPALKPGKNVASAVGEIGGSFIPITGLMKVFNNPLTRLAAKSPVLQKQLSSLANLRGIKGAGKLLGTGLAGGTYGAISEANKKEEMPSTEDFLEHGATWALLDGALQAAGGGARFAKALLSKAKKTKIPEWKLVNETINKMREEGVDFSNPERVQAKALSILEEQAPKAVAKEIEEPLLQGRKVEQKVFDKLEGEIPAEPYLPKQFEALETVEKASSEQLDASLEALAPRVTTEKQLGENIKAAIDKGLQEAEAIYTPAYETAKEAASTISTTPFNTSKLAVNTLQNLESLTTKPEGFKQTIKTIEDALTDAGFVLQRNKEGLVEGAVAASEVQVSKLMELGRRLNKIVKYDSIDKSVRDLIKPVIQTLKQDIKLALAGDKHALEMYEKAEREFGKSANKFGKESIRKIRKMEAGEKVAKLIRNPTTLADLKEVMPEGQFKEVEREVLEQVKTLNEGRARSGYRELRPYLSTDAQAVGEEILESKIPKAEPTRKEALRNKVKETFFDDLSKSTITGQRPTKALDLWKTKEGQQLIKESLKDNPNKKEILDFLSNQSLKDMTASIVSAEGEINFKKLNEFMKDPATRENIRLISGEEGVNFFNQLETLSKRADRNLSIMEGRIDKGSAAERKATDKVLSKRGEGKLERFKEKELQKTKDTLLYKFDDFISGFGIKTKALFALLGFAEFGIPGVVEGTVAFEVLKRVLKNKNVQRGIKQIAGPRNDPKNLLQAYEALDRAMTD